SLDMMRDVPLAGDALAIVDALYPGLDAERRTHEMTRRVMTMMVEDVIRTALESLERLQPMAVADIHDAGETIVCFSDGMAEKERALKAFLFANLYRHPDVLRVRESAEQVVSDLYHHFIAHPVEMGGPWAMQVEQLDTGGRARLVADYLAGMTDSFAVKAHRSLFDVTPELG
ncbi:MAG: deoxyguanosinetriphosphate triphosphohydrolase, partial [Pseudomonadota bacterium]